MRTAFGQRCIDCLSAGTVAAGGADWGLVDANGAFNPDVVYVLQTHDGGNVLVREKGHAPNLFLLFETGSDEYDWLNSVVAYGQGVQVPGGGVSLNVWQVSIPFNYPWASCLKTIAEMISKLTNIRWALRIEMSSLADYGSWSRVSCLSITSTTADALQTGTAQVTICSIETLKE